MLELYHWEPNGSWLKPLIALHEKGLTFRGRYVDVLSFEQYRPGLYLEDAFPATPLRPVEPIGQARILAWARFINEVLMPAVNTLGCHAYLAPQFADRDLAPFEPLLARIPMKYLQEGWRRALTDSSG
jgi:glutathione S-transferase